MQKKLSKAKADTLLTEAKDRFREAEKAWSSNRENAIEDLKYSIADDINQWQWSDADIKDRRESKRPMITINKIAGAIDQVEGDQKQNKPAIKTRPVDSDADPETSEILNGLIRNIENTSNAESAYDTGFDLMLRGGYGAWRIKNDYEAEDSFYQELKICRIDNPFNVLVDPSAQEQDYSDMGYAFIHRTYTKNEFEKKYPDAKSTEWVSTHDNDDQTWFGDDSVRVAEYFRRKPIVKTYFQLSDLSVICLEDFGDTKKAQKEGVQTFLEQNQLEIVKQKRGKGHKVEHYVITANEILEGPNVWAGKYIPVVLCLGKELNIRGERYYRGMVRLSRDAQRVYNYFRTSDIEYVSQQPKAPYIATEDQLEGYEHIWKTAHVKQYGALIYNHREGVPMPSRQMPPQTSSGFGQQSLFAADDIKSTTGLFNASLGDRSNETSGKAIMARQREGDVATFTFIDNLSKAMQYTGKILVDAIPKIYDTARTVRTLGADGKTEFVEINKKYTDVEGNERTVHDLSQGRYDVVVDVGPSYTTQRVEAAESLMELMKIHPEAPMVAGDLLVGNMDIPNSEELATRLKKIMPPNLLTEQEKEEAGIQPEQPNPQQQQMQQQQQQIQQMQQQLQQMELQKLQLELAQEQEQTKQETIQTKIKQLELMLKGVEPMQPHR